MLVSLQVWISATKPITPILAKSSYEYDVLPHPITLGIVGTLHSQVDVARRENQHHGLASLNG